MNYLLHLVVLLEIYVMLALSLNLMVGYTGLVTMAHAAFYGIGSIWHVLGRQYPACPRDFQVSSDYAFIQVVAL
jgi:ABC-type branched-subunit amino acid transport system permease subunit